MTPPKHRSPQEHPEQVFGPVLRGQRTLCPWAESDDAGEVIETTGAGSPLSTDTCRDRLASSRRGHLACTEGGLPCVRPVELRVESGELLVLDLGHQFEGQVVALSIGKHAFRYSRGWNVIARGRLGTARPDGALPLEIADLDGVTSMRPTSQRRS